MARMEKKRERTGREQIRKEISEEKGGRLKIKKERERNGGDIKR